MAEYLETYPRDVRCHDLEFLTSKIEFLNAREENRRSIRHRNSVRNNEIWFDLIRPKEYFPNFQFQFFLYAIDFAFDTTLDRTLNLSKISILKSNTALTLTVLGIPICCRTNSSTISFSAFTSAFTCDRYSCVKKVIMKSKWKSFR